MPRRTLLLGSLSLRRIQTALVILGRFICRNKYGGEFEWYLAGVDYLVPLPRRDPERYILLHFSFLAIVLTNSFA